MNTADKKTTAAETGFWMQIGRWLEKPESQWKPQMTASLMALETKRLRTAPRLQKPMGRLDFKRLAEQNEMTKVVPRTVRAMAPSETQVQGTVDHFRSAVTSADELGDAIAHTFSHENLASFTRRAGRMIRYVMAHGQDNLPNHHRETFFLAGLVSSAMTLFDATPPATVAAA